MCLFSTFICTGLLVPLYMRGADWAADAEAERSELEKEAEKEDVDDQVAEFERYNRFTLLNVAHSRNGLLWLAAILAAYANLLQLCVLSRARDERARARPPGRPPLSLADSRSLSIGI